MVILKAGGRAFLRKLMHPDSASSAAGKAMAELGVAACIGAGCVRQELLDRSVVSALSKTTFGILLPMFLGTSILRTVAKYGLSKSSLAGPLLGILQPYLLYQLVQWVVLPLFGLDGDSDDGRCTAVCSAWGNTSVVPLIFVESLFRNQSDDLAKSYANISLFLVGWSPFFWSFGRAVLLGNNDNDDAPVAAANQHDIRNSSHDDDENENENENKRLLPIRVLLLIQKLKPLFPPPVLGVSIGLILALFAPVRNLFVNGPLQTVFDSFATFGRAASPLSLLVLTSSLALNVGVRPKSQPKDVDSKKAAAGETSTSAQKTTFLRQWMCVSVSRFLLSPLLVVGLLKIFQSTGLISSPQQDPLLWFLSILQGCMPSAQNLVLMLQVSNQPERAGAIAKFLFFVYATSMLPVVVIVGMALQRFGLAY